MFPNQSDPNYQPPAQPQQPQTQPVQHPQTSYVTPTPSQAPDKKTIIIGGIILIMVIVIAAVLLFGGSGNTNNEPAWQRLVSSQNQIPVITKAYQQDLSSLNLQNAAATAQISWMSNNQAVLASYKSSLGKTALSSSAIINPKIKKTLDEAKNAGNLDSAFAKAIIDQVNLVDKDAQLILSSKPSKQTKAQLLSTSQLVKITAKQMQDATSSL